MQWHSTSPNTHSQQHKVLSDAAVPVTFSFQVLLRDERYQVGLHLMKPMRIHAGRDPCLLAGQCSMRSDQGGHSDPVGSPASPQGMYSSSAQARSAGGAASPQAATARPAMGGPYRGVQGGCQPMTARGPPVPCSTGHYHSSGASTWRGTYSYPLAIGSSRYAG